jgi:hypothetical protein
MMFPVLIAVEYPPTKRESIHLEKWSLERRNNHLRSSIVHLPLEENEEILFVRICCYLISIDNICKLSWSLLSSFKVSTNMRMIPSTMIPFFTLLLVRFFLLFRIIFKT